jgi:hypothetical protein
MGRKKQSWTSGDMFAVELRDGTFAAGQIIGREAQVLNSVTIALFDQRFNTRDDVLACDVGQARACAILFATRDLLDAGRWYVVGRRPIEIPTTRFPYEHTRASGYVGAKVTGAGILFRFVEAYFGLAPWDDFKDPTYLDRLLVAPEKKPRTVLLKGRPAQ